MEIRKNISIVEFDYHTEVLINSLLVLRTLPFNISLFTSSNIWAEISKSDNWEDLIVYKVDSHRDVKKLILDNIDVLNESQFILFNTLASNFKLFSNFDFKAIVILRIHNANAYFNARRSINPKLSIFYIWKDMSYLIHRGILKGEIVYRSRFVKNKVDYFLLPNKVVKEFVLNQKYTTPDKLLSSIPYIYQSERAARKSPISVIRIVITGIIDKRRRNYQEVLNAFKNIAPLLNIKVELCLLGKPAGLYGLGMIKKYKQLETDFLRIRTFRKFIDQSIFNDIAEQADFFIIPTVRETRYKLYKELYGFSKISGGVNDMIIYKKPALIPSFYPIEDSLKSYIQSYKDENNLTEILISWINDREFQSHVMSSIIDEFRFDFVAKKTWNSLQHILRD
ncbi:MAG: hypothetical protein KKG99_09390 [Bacteroidetes bacterium]|nr:hypothetical protein [Bacteroidota bacterium]